MAEKEPIAVISVITDDDTGMYSIGEVDGGFAKAELKQHIEDYGSGGIINHLACMTAMVVEVSREIQSAKLVSKCGAGN